MKSASHRQLLSILACAAALWAGVAPASAQGSTSASRAKALLAGQLVDDARTAGRNLQLPPDLAARESLVLLQKAEELDPQSKTVLRLLAEAAGALHRTALERQALLNLVKLDPKNIVAQLKFLDSLAAGAQTVAARIKIYQHTMAQPQLDPQMKSALALRIGQLLNAQAHHHAANLMFVEAVKLNKANLAAWQELALEKFRGGFGPFNSPLNPFMSQRVAMEIQGPYFANFIEKNNPKLIGEYGVAPFPTSFGPPGSAVFGDCDVWAIPRGARHVQAALTVLNFFIRRKNIEYLCDKQCKPSPLMKVSRNFIRRNPNPYIKLFERVTKSKNVQLAPMDILWSRVYSDLHSCVQRIWTGHSVSRSLAHCQRAADRWQANIARLNVLRRQEDHQ